MPSRLTIVLSVLLVSLLCTLGLTLRWGVSQYAAATQLREDVKALTTERDVLDARLRALPAELQRQRDARKGAEHALNEDPTWRDSAVPKPVADGLCARLRCASVHPVPTSNR